VDRERWHLDEGSGVVVVPMQRIQLRKKIEVPHNEMWNQSFEGF
jgi:hypothetical protein